MYDDPGESLCRVKNSNNTARKDWSISINHEKTLQEIIDITIKTGAQGTAEKSFSFDPDLEPISV
jgi:hypothetical protein